MNKVELGNGLWYDIEEDKNQREFYQQKEKEYWDYVFSGQRTLDLFGEGGAKTVLVRQAKEDKKLTFKHKSRGK